MTKSLTITLYGDGGSTTIDEIENVISASVSERFASIVYKEGEFIKTAIWKYDNDATGISIELVTVNQ